MNKYLTMVIGEVPRTHNEMEVILAKERYRRLVFIGRFSPFHHAHLDIIRRGLDHADEIMVLIGSSDEPRTFRNPFTYDERKEMILGSCEDTNLDVSRIKIKKILDFPYNNTKWIEQVQSVVMADGIKDVGLTGYEKDNTSFYIKMFPDWGSVPYTGDLFRDINATDIRKDFFIDNKVDVFKIPDFVRECLKVFSKSHAYSHLAETARFLGEYNKKWAFSPYPVNFVTTDAVVVQSGCILLIKRGRLPGKGLWALPGGFLNPNESVIDGLIRELCEETKIDLPKGILRQNVLMTDYFSDIHRDERGRVITFASYIDLDKEIDRKVIRGEKVTRTKVKKNPKVLGSDDAVEARWVNISEIRREMMYSDHYHIIHSMIEKVEMMKRKV